MIKLRKFTKRLEDLATSKALLSLRFSSVFQDPIGFSTYWASLSRSQMTTFAHMQANQISLPARLKTFAQAIQLSHHGKPIPIQARLFTTGNSSWI
jgi:hypothetical protein